MGTIIFIVKEQRFSGSGIRSSSNCSLLLESSQHLAVWKSSLQCHLFIFSNLVSATEIYSYMSACCFCFRMATLFFFFFLKLHRRQNIPIAVSWFKPQVPWKLNVDSNSLGNLSFAGGGIVIRDSGGTILMPEAIHFRLGISISAKSMAFMGLQLCVANKMERVAVETNSMSLFHFLTTQVSWPWSIFSIRSTSKELLHSVSAFFTHIYGEANTVVDFLARHASSN